ncbi:hypothetical protein INT44_001143 [Umbelopsis vinacea]|uniref:EVE domain-containing protein n=1 Tax=Umbelopsis vinacea TaxID=44442 RepID=A0A8H7UM91_9FUNG|nr:hypothetical protein INT44_001143 [Umbelopsis vinacea]
MAPTLRNRETKDETAAESASHKANAIVKSKRAPESKVPKSRKKVKKEESKDSTETKENEEGENETKSKVPKPRKNVKTEKSEDSTETKENEEVENETKSKRKTKTKASVKQEALPDAPVKKNDKEYQHWLMKAEPDSRVVKDKDVKFSIDDLEAMPERYSKISLPLQRNFEARNMMRDRMKVGHKVLFYHSNCKQPGVAGIAEIVKEGYVDCKYCEVRYDTAFDPKHPYFDPKSDEANPKWYMVCDRIPLKYKLYHLTYSIMPKVDVKFVRKLNRLIPLKELQSYKGLSDMVLIKRGRLSVQPVTKEEYDFILSAENKDDDQDNDIGCIPSLDGKDNGP